MGLTNPPRLLVAELASSPVAFGLWRPTVLVPRALLEGLDPRSLRAVLAHELAHHRRKDLWVHTTQRILGTIWWFNPIFHWLDRELRRTREQCCDDLAVTLRGVDHKSYCRALLDSAEICTAGASRAAAAQGILELPRIPCSGSKCDLK